MSVVVDSSATLAWVYADETTKAINEVFAGVNERGAWVPALWRLEVANVLEMGVRRGRHDAAFRDATLEDLALLRADRAPASAMLAVLRVSSGEFPVAQEVVEVRFVSLISSLALRFRPLWVGLRGERSPR